MKNMLQVHFIRKTQIFLRNHISHESLLILSNSMQMFSKSVLFYFYFQFLFQTLYLETQFMYSSEIEIFKLIFKKIS